MALSSEFVRRLGRRTVQAGATALTLSAAFAILHYGFGVAFRSRVNDVYGAATDMATVLPLLACAGLFLIAAGMAILTWRRDPSSD